MAEAAEEGAAEKRHAPLAPPQQTPAVDGGSAPKETGGIAAVVGQGLLEDFPAVLGLCPRKAEGHIRIGLTKYVRNSQRIAFDGRFPGNCEDTSR